MILTTLAGGERHGLGVSRHIERVTRGAFIVRPGSLFPSLHRLEAAGCLRSRWGESESRRQAKYYVLTPHGRRRLHRELRYWRDTSLAIMRVARPALPESLEQ